MNFSSAWTRVLEWWPLVWKSTMYAEIERCGNQLIENHSRNFDMQQKEYDKKLADQVRVLNVRHEKALEDRSKQCDEIISKISKLGFERLGGDRYRISVDFDPRITFFEREEIAYIARHVGRTVEHEICTSKFVQQAIDTEDRRRWLDRNRGVPYP